VTELSGKDLAIVGGGSTVAAIILVLILTGTTPLFQSTSGPPSGCGLCGAPPFSIGNAIAVTCPPQGSFIANGCSAGDYVYNVTIESSSIQFGEVVFKVTSSSGAPYVATGGTPGFSILNESGKMSARWSATDGNMTMSGGWSYSQGTTSSTQLNSLYALEVDMGTVNPHDLGYNFEAIGLGRFSGSTAIVGLP